MGWLGTSSELYYALATVGADKTKDGKYIVKGSISSFLGLGDEFVVGDDACYFVDGKQCSVAGLLNSTSYGVRNVKVFG